MFRIFKVFLFFFFVVVGVFFGAGMEFRAFCVLPKHSTAERLLQPTADRTWPSQLLTRPRDEKSAGILHMNHSIPIRSFSPHNYRLMHTYTFFPHMIESISFPSIMQHVQTFYQALIINSQPAPSIGMKQIGKCDNNAFLSLC